MRQADADAALRARVTSAAVIVTGRVVRPPVRLPPSGPASEHNPDWWSAPVEVITSIQGARAKDIIEVAFAYNYDSLWQTAPKLRLGQEGVFLLHRFSEKDIDEHVHGILKVPEVRQLLVIDPLDVQPLAERNRIAAFAKSR